MIQSLSKQQSESSIHADAAAATRCGSDPLAALGPKRVAAPARDEMRQHTGDQTMRTTTTTEQQQFYLNQSTGNTWGELTWKSVEPGKLLRADTQLGSYNLELQPDGKTLRLTFNSGCLPDEVSGKQ